MAQEYPVLSASVVIDSTNRTLRFATVAAPTAYYNATVQAGTYYVVNNTDTAMTNAGIASNKLHAAVKDAINAALSVGANGSTSALDINPANKSYAVVFTSTTSIIIDWVNAATTFPAAVLGFTSATTTGTTHTNNVSPSAVWVGSESLRDDMIGPFGINTSQNVMTSGKVRTFNRGVTTQGRKLECHLMDGERTLTYHNASDSGAPVETFLGIVKDGRRMTYHSIAISSGTLLTDIANADDREGEFVLDKATFPFVAKRYDPALDLYDFDIYLRKYIA